MKRVVLCRPEGPRNLGSILRAAENFGPAEVVVVAPARPSLLVHPEFEQMSHGADAARARLRVEDDLAAALAGAHHAVGFTARARDKRVRRDWRALAAEVTPMADDAEHVLALVFGSEESGLTVEEADRCQVLAHLRTAPDHRSINLAMAVTIVLHSLFTGTEVHQVERNASWLNDEGRRFLKARLVEVFAGKVARTPAAARDIEASIERVFSRAPLEARDARAWHLMLRALGSTMEPTELGLRPHEKGGRRRDALARRERGEEE